MRPLPLIVATCCLLTAAACTSDTESGPGPNTPYVGSSRASYAVTECPDDVTGFAFGDVECGRLTVPEHRDGSAGTVDVFVTRIRPPGATSDPQPIVVVPGVGGVPNYLGVSPLAQRTGREVIIVDGRGIGHSEPSLECPEVTQSTERALSRPTRDPSVAAGYLAAVGACAQRFRTQGVDPAAFTITETAADLVDLRVELGVTSWVVAAYGNAARFVPELMRLDASAVNAVILDSPELPGMDPPRIAVEETPQVVQALLTECARDAACSTRYPRVVGLWADALREVKRRPIRLEAGRPLGKVLLDDGLLVRIARQAISDGGSSGLAWTPGSLPAVLTDVADRGGAVLDNEIAPLVAAQDPFCLGYGAHCLKRMHLVPGAYLSVMCHDILPFTEPLSDIDPMLVRVSTARVNPSVCSRWDVGEADNVGAPVDWDAPTLVFVGRFAPYTPVAAVREATTGLPKSTVVVDPGGADNVLPRTECALALRGTWLEDPTASAEAPPCLRDERVRWNLG